MSCLVSQGKRPAGTIMALIFPCALNHPQRGLARLSPLPHQLLPTDSGTQDAGAGSHSRQGWLFQQVRPVLLASGRASWAALPGRSILLSTAQHRLGFGVMAPRAKGWPTAGMGLTPGPINRANLGLGLGCRR